MFPPIDPREIDYLPERMCCNSIAEEIRKLQKDSEYKINKQLLENAISLTKDIAYAVDLKSSFNSKKLHLWYWVFGGVSKIILFQKN